MKRTWALAFLLPIAAALCAVSIGFGVTPQKEQQVEVKSTIKEERPPAGALPQEANDSSCLDLLKKGFAYLGDISYTDRRRGAKSEAVKQALLMEAQSSGAQIVRLIVGKGSELESTPAYTRRFSDGRYQTTWSSPGGYKSKAYIYGHAEVFVSDMDLASQQMQILERRRRETDEKRAMLRDKVRNAEKAMKTYESAHPDDKIVSLVWIGSLKRTLEETEPTLKQLTEPMSAAVRDVERYLDGGLEGDLKVNYLKCGDRMDYLEALCSASNYLQEIREALSINLNDPSAVLVEKR
jgi:hypothetical protein